MRWIRQAVAPFALAAALPGTDAVAQTFPVTAGTLEFQLGLATITLPEDHDGTYSFQAEGRGGWFVAEGLQAQAEAHVRMYPLGNQAPGSYGLGLAALWFPELGEFRNLYVLGGAAIQYLSYPAHYDVSNGVRPLLRAGGGLKVPLENSGIPFLRNGHLTIEYRGEWILLTEDEVDPAVGNKLDFQSGIALGYSIFR